jgi:hypothetical protein
LKDRDVEEWAKIVWINLLESAEVAFVTHQSNVPDLRWVNGWRRGLLETLLWGCHVNEMCFVKKGCKSKVFEVSQVYTFWITSHIVSLAGFGYFVVMSCIEVWVCNNVIKTEVRHKLATTRLVMEESVLILGQFYQPFSKRPGTTQA